MACIAASLTGGGSAVATGDPHCELAGRNAFNMRTHVCVMTGIPGETQLERMLDAVGLVGMGAVPHACESTCGQAAHC